MIKKITSASSAAILILILILIILMQQKHAAGEEGKDKYDLQNAEILLKHTPIKDQGKTDACWIYAYLACIETERIEHYADSVNLSPLWLIRADMMQKARECYLTKGSRNITPRGIGPQAENLMKEYGMVQWSNYKPDENLSCNAIARDITNKTNIAIMARKGINTLNEEISNALPPLPHNIKEGFYLYSAHYSPKQFANSLRYGIKTQWLTSYTHHPFHTAFDIELPDNTQHHKIMNVPIDTLYQMTITALRNHHPVFWEGKMPDSCKEETTENPDYKKIQQQRQSLFENFKVTDQHAMAIIGLIKDKNNLHFICKNSWGKDWGNNGYYLMTTKDFLLNTIIAGIMK